MRDSDQEQVAAPQLLPGLAIAWTGVVLLVSSCIVLGMGWGLRAGQGPLLTAQPPLPSSVSLGGGQETLMALASAEDTPAQMADTTASLAPTRNRAFGYGIEIQSRQENITLTLDEVQALGLDWIKYRVNWANMEPEPGKIDWDELDGIIVSASAHNLKVLLDVISAPTWTRSVTTTGKNGPPDDPERYANFLRQIVQRYPDAIHAVEIWNEQNLGNEWYTAGGLNPSGYMNLLLPSSKAIHRLDPEIVVISGALMPTGRDDGVTAIDDFRYMREMIAAGLLEHVDCVGVGHSGFNLSPAISSEDAFFGEMPSGTRFIGPYDATNSANPHHSWSFYSTLNGYNSMIVAAGGSTPLCVTEFGWASAEGIGEPPSGFEFAYDNTPQAQGDYIVQAFQSMHNGGFVQLGILFNLDYAVGSDSLVQTPDRLFSILLPNGSPRPAFQAVQDMPKLP
ncbi:MAG: cellulase family glycosylhydrolase [Anaerolineae bacterium]|nr:cellulase family glycosylhydrolase [Anaerolineae bacterium]